MTAPAGQDQDWDATMQRGLEPLDPAEESRKGPEHRAAAAPRKKAGRATMDPLPQEARALGVGEVAFEDSGEFAYLPLEQLFESPSNPRTHFDAAKLEELTASVRTSGILAPLVVRPAPKGRYEIGAGHRRYRAAKAADLAEVPAVVRRMDDREFLELLAIENLQRDDLHPLEEAQGYQQLMTAAGYDVPQIAERTGHSSRYVYDSLTPLKLIPAAKQLFLAGKFERGHAIEIARLTPAQQTDLVGLEPDDFRRERTGLWESERVERDPHADDQEDLALEDAVKPVSVRELKHYINDHIRATPDAVDPFLFPQTAEQLAAAAAGKKKVVHITYEYRVPDAARDPKIRTYGEAGWKRADGEYQSRRCDHAVLGLVVAGPGRGEAFPVCVAKEKCAVHWVDWQKERARRQAELAKDTAKKSGTTKGAAGAPEQSRQPVLTHQAEQVFQEAIIAEWAPTWMPKIQAIAAEFAKLPDLLLWNLAQSNFELEGWAAKVGQRPKWEQRVDYDLGELLETKLLKLKGRRPVDVPSSRLWLGLQVLAARDGKEIQKAIEAEVQRRWKAELAAKASPKKAPKPAAKTRAQAKGKKQ